VVTLTLFSFFALGVVSGVMKQSTNEAGIIPASTRGFFGVTLLDPPGRLVNELRAAGLEGFDDPMNSVDGVEAPVVEAGIVDDDGNGDGAVGDARGEALSLLVAA